MTERNPIPACLSHLEQSRPKPASNTALHWLIKDLRTYAKLADEVCEGDASEAMLRAADHMEATMAKPTPIVSMKLCRDCALCRFPGHPDSPCLHDSALAPRTNVVTGAQETAPLYCVNQRGYGGACGLEARLFQPGKDWK